MGVVIALVLVAFLLLCVYVTVERHELHERGGRCGCGCDD